MRKTRLLALLLAILMIVGTLAIIPVTADEAGGWDGETITAPAGKGTKEEPYLIASAENLAWISYMTKNFRELNEDYGYAFASSNVFEGVYFIQTADIDLGGKEFTPIGSMQANDELKRNAFAGSYDGRSYKISNAVITPESQVKKTGYNDFMASGFCPGGIFGVIAVGSTVSGINACNIKVGTINTKTMLRNRLYSLTVAGVIVGMTYGNATVTDCTTDADCEVYALYSAGGIMGMPELGAYISGCVNGATVSASYATGGIVGMMYNTDIVYCINRGKVAHYTTDRWSGAGGMTGVLGNTAQNANNSISYCINEGEISATSLQAGGSGTNRVALGGMMGHDGIGHKASIKYSYCYNMQKHFNIKYLDNGNTAVTHLAMCGAVSGSTLDAANTVERIHDHCYGVEADYTYDWSALSAESVLGGNGVAHSDKTKTFAFNWNEQSGEGAVSEQPYAGILGAELTPTQVAAGVGNPATAFATCQYGVAEETLKAHPEYQATVLRNATNEAFANAPKYAGVQETLDKSAGKYELRFVLTTSRTDYVKAGVEVVASYGNNQMQTFTLTADKYHNSLSGKKADGTGINYTAASFGAEKLMALTLPVDLAAYGAATYTVTPYFIQTEGGAPSYGRAWTVNYAADGSFVDQSIVEIVNEGEADNTALYTIVYPEESVLAPIYTAIAVQNHILTKRGKILPLATERSEDPDAHEIVIVEDQTMETGAYKTEVEGNRLIVTAADTFGYIAAANRLTKQLLANGRINLDDSYVSSGVFEGEMIREKNGETRVMFQNVWCSIDNISKDKYLFSVTNYQYHIATVALYQPDVFAVNEFWYAWEVCGFIEAMAAMGYERVMPVVDGQNVKLGNSIFYNTATTDYVADSAKYLSYGDFVSVDMDGDGIREAIRRNTGDCVGRYLDNSDNRGSTAHAATFTDKTTGQSYTVCSSHFIPNAQVDPQIAPLGNALRLEQMEKLIPFLKAYQEEYGATILLGGDYNNADSYDYRSGGYKAGGDTNPWYFDWANKANNHSGGYAESWDDHKANPNKALTTYTYTYLDGTTAEKEYLWGACDELRANGFINTKNETNDTTYNVSTQGYPIRSDVLDATVQYTGSTVNDPSADNYSGSIDHIYALESFEGELETLRYRNIANEVSLSTADHKPVLIDFNLLTEAEAEANKPTSGDLEGETWQGMNDRVAPTNGSGTEEDPYLIERPEHLAWLSAATNDVAIADAFLGTKGLARANFQGVYFKQTADIDLAGLAFTPIGDYQNFSDYTQRHGFAGHYDGNGFAIKNATINANEDNGKTATDTFKSNTYLSGIFGLISAGASVKNVHAKNVKVGKLLSENASKFDETYCETVAGVIVGAALQGTVTGCTTDENCSAIGVYAGGIVAFQDSSNEVSYCVNRAEVVGFKGVGGIIGMAEANVISYNVNYADIKLITFDRWNGAGGIIGMYAGTNATITNTVSNCINYGNMSAIDRSTVAGGNHRVGLGGIAGNDNSAKQSTYENCFNLASEFTASVVLVPGTAQNFLACSGGILGYACDHTGARTYTNCYSVAGSTDVDYFGTAKNDFAWNGNGMNGTAGINSSAYAGLMTGEMSDAQVKLQISGSEITELEEAFATCHYGVEAAEIEANETYLAILDAVSAN